MSLDIGTTYFYNNSHGHAGTLDWGKLRLYFSDLIKATLSISGERKYHLWYGISRGCTGRTMSHKSHICFYWHLSRLDSPAGSCCSVTHFLSHVGSSQPATWKKTTTENQICLISQSVKYAQKSPLKCLFCQNLGHPVAVMQIDICFHTYINEYLCRFIFTW